MIPEHLPPLGDNVGRLPYEVAAVGTEQDIGLGQVVQGPPHAVPGALVVDHGEVGDEPFGADPNPSQGPDVVCHLPQPGGREPAHQRVASGQGQGRTQE